VRDVAGTSSVPALVAHLTNKLDRAGSATPGDYHQWAEAWATDSIKEALLAYQGIQFGTAQFNTHHQLQKISITLPANYEQDKTPTVEKQLAKAACRLADLLDKIQWSP